MTAESVEPLNRSMAEFDYYAVATPAGDDGLLVGLVPTHDLSEATRQRRLIEVTAALLIVIGLLLVGLVLAHNIARPLEAIVAVAVAITCGSYARRVPSSSIRELDDLSRTINQLTEQLELQRAELHQRAFHDPLTGLPNRALLQDRLVHALDRAPARAVGRGVVPGPRQLQAHQR